MNDKELRVKVAELCGWREYAAARDAGKAGILLPWKWINERTGEKTFEPPDYPNDLNAMHEAENALTDDEHDRFRDHLGSILCDGKYYHWSDGGGMRGFVSATARQRAEAFVKTLAS